MSPEDKLAVLRKNYDSVTELVRASEGSSAEGQNAAQAKSKEHFAKITSRLFEIEHTDGTGPAAIKDAVDTQINDLKKDMQTAIEQANKALDDYDKSFKEIYETTELEEPIVWDELLEEHIDSMPDTLFDELTSRSLDKPTIDTVAELKEVYDLVKDFGIADKNGNLLDDWLNVTLEENLKGHALLEHMQISDVRKLRDWLSDVKGISYMFRNDVTNAQIATKLLKIMKTDSYAPITKILNPEHIEKLERVALSSLYLKDGILTEKGRINFWALYRDARSIRAVSPEMVAVKELMRVYANHVGTSRLTTNAILDLERGGKVRDNIASESASRGLGQVIAWIHQYFPTAAGRNTYIYRHALKLIKGESVPSMEDLSTRVINRQLARAFDDANAALERQGYSPTPRESTQVNSTGEEIPDAIDGLYSFYTIISVFRMI
jgi:hypothetical protein